MGKAAAAHTQQVDNPNSVKQSYHSCIYSTRPLFLGYLNLGGEEKGLLIFTVDFGKPFTNLGELPKVFFPLCSAAVYRIGASRAYLKIPKTQAS